MKLLLTVLFASATCAGAALAASGEVGGRGIGFDQTSACEQARTDARGAAQLDAMRGAGPVRITGYSTCQCEQLPTSPQNNSNRWQCTVRANYTN